MSRSIRRILPPTMLLVGGLCALVYGVGVRRLPIWRDVEVEKETVILQAPPKELFAPRFGQDGRRMEMPMPPPRARKIKVKVAEPKLVDEPEQRVIREVSVGGIARLADGRLQLTYGPGKAGPALCPT